MFGSESLDHHVHVVGPHVGRSQDPATVLAGGRPKAVLRALAERRFGAGAFDEPKGQFSVPFGDWMRGPLTDETRRRVLRLAARGLVHQGVVERLLDEHLGGTQNHTRKLRALFVLDLWLERIVGAVGTSAGGHPHGD